MWGVRWGGGACGEGREGRGGAKRVLGCGGFCGSIASGVFLEWRVGWWAIDLPWLLDGV